MKHLTVKSVVIALALLTVNCSTTKRDGRDNAPIPSVSAQHKNAMSSPSQAGVMPKAHIYKTNGNYNDNVSVTMNADGSQLISYPAPSDISNASAPLPLADGYLLDRRGISPTTAFTSYTYSRYSALSTAPDASQLIKSIIPGAKVTEIVELPMTTSQAASDTARCNNLIREGLPGCKVLMAPQVYHLQE